jgi:methylated-DNA-protein-cysteine methyltransferase-like protein
VNDLDRERRILDVLRALEEGEVTTYGDVAEVAGYPKQARLVGRILATTDVEVPWWRVVNAAGRIVSGHPAEQANLLRAEGVVVVDQRVTDAPLGRFRPSRSGRRPGRPSSGP